MILVRRLVPAAAHDEEPRWSDPIALNDESELLPLPDGQWGVWAPTKATVDADAANPAPKGWNFDRIVNTETDAPKMSVRKVR